MALSSVAAEYTGSMPAGEYDFPYEGLRYNTKQSDGEASVMLEFWGMWSTPSLPLIPCPL